MAQADLRGDITKTGGEDLDERGFVYGTSSHGDPGNTAPSSSSYASNVTQTSGPYSTGNFTITETGLSTGTTYYYRAVGHNSAGWSYGDEVSFFIPVVVVESGTITATLFSSSSEVGAGTETALLQSTADHFTTEATRAVEVGRATGVASLTQAEVGDAAEAASATGAGGLSAPSVAVGTEAPSVVSAGSLATSESGVGAEQPTATATVTPSVLGELITVALSPALTGVGQGAVGEDALTNETALLAGAANQGIVGQAIAAGSATLSSIGSLTSTENGTAAEAGTATGVGQGTTATTTRARESATVGGTAALSLLNLLLRVSPQITLTADGGGSVAETGVSRDAASLIGVGAGAITEFGVAQLRPAASAIGAPSLFSTGIALESASPSTQTSLLAREIGALLPVLTLSGQGALTATERGRTAVASRLAETATPSVTDAGVKGVSALLSLATATSTTDRAVAGERIDTVAKGTFALDATSRAAEDPSVPVLAQLITKEAASSQESATSSATGDFVIFEIGEGIAFLSPVTLRGVSALDVAESSRTGEVATMTVNGSGVVVERGVTGASALLQIGSDTTGTETGIALTAPTARAAVTLATLDPALRADEAAAILTTANVSVLADVSARIAEVRAVLRDQIATNARLRNSLLIDVLLQD